MALQPFQQRVVDEKAALDAARDKLIAFTGTAQFTALPIAEQYRMQRQAAAMYLYSSILGERIAAFGG